MSNESESMSLSLTFSGNIGFVWFFGPIHCPKCGTMLRRIDPPDGEGKDGFVYLECSACKGSSEAKAEPVSPG